MSTWARLDGIDAEVRVGDQRNVGDTKFGKELFCSVTAVDHRNHTGHDTARVPDMFVGLDD